MASELEQKLLNYIDILEKTNEQLLETVKRCVEVLEQMRGLVPDPEGWEEMLNLFHETIKAGERVSQQKTFH